jgi:fatty-acyl-CoA synthase
LAETVVALLDHAAARPEVGVRIVDRNEAEEWRSWTEVRERAFAVCGGLQALGVEPGQVVALVFPTGFPFLEAFLGTLLAGAVPAPLYPPAKLGRLDEYHERTAAMLRAAGAVVVLADPRVRLILGPAVLAARPALGCHRLERLPAGRPRPTALRDEDLGLVQFSSGTTVEPKPVALTHRALVTQARLLNAQWPDTPELRHSGVSWLPLYHDMGLIGSILPALERPGPLTLIAPEQFIARPALWLRTISRYRATISPAPNFAYALCTRMVKDAELGGVDLSPWRVAITGAETVVPEVVRAFVARFARWGFRPEAMTPGYGLSEAALGVTLANPWRPPTCERFDRAALAAGRAVTAPDGLELMSVGRALPGFEVRVADERGRLLGDALVGRILVRGPSLMAGYLGRPEATAAVLQDGVLDTGDRGFVRDGELYLSGRDKEVLIVNGRNHLPEELERAASAVPGVRPGGVAALAHREEGDATEQVMLLVEATAEASAEERADLPKRCAERVLAVTGVRPALVVLVEAESLPRTSSGKLRRREALRRHLEGTLTGPRRVTAALLAGALARSQVAYLKARRSRGRDGG